jgi:uncharacterized protein YjbJ (UPF0337 family)
VIKGKAKRICGERTDDDLLAAEGSAARLHGTIQARLGETRATIQRKLADLHVP